MSKVSNALLMLQYLSNGRKYSVNELASLLEVTPRMIRSYKDDLDKAGIYIDTIRGPYGGYILKQRIDFNKEVFNSNLNDNDLVKYNILNKAIKEKRKVKIVYDSNRDKNKVRIIEPSMMYLFKDGWYCMAFCELRNEMRQFSLVNIKDIELLNDFYI